MSSDREWVTTPLVYVAGPYSSDPVANTRRAIGAGLLLWRRHGVGVIIPHLSMLADFVEPMEVADWYAFDLAQLVHCHAVLRLSGDSVGAEQECAYAHEMGIPVFPSVQALEKWLAATYPHLLDEPALFDEDEEVAW